MRRDYTINADMIIAVDYMIQVKHTKEEQNAQRLYNKC